MGRAHRSMDPKPQVEFDQGFFKFTTPYTWQGWAWWILIILIMVGSLFFQPQGYIISLVMFVVLAMLSPTGLEAKLHRMRKQNPLPEDLEAQALNKGTTIEDWFMERNHTFQQRIQMVGSTLHQVRNHG